MHKTKVQNRSIKYKISKSLIDKKKLEKIKKEVEKEFPNDDALQQIHIARKLISIEAKAKGMSLIEYIKSCSKKN